MGQCLRPGRHHLLQPPDLVHVRARRTPGPGRVPLLRPGASYLRRVSLSPRLRRRALGAGAARRPLRQGRCLPRWEPWFHHLQYRLRCLEKYANAHRLPLPGRSRWLSPHDCWWGHHWRPHAARAARSCHHGLEPPCCGWPHRWPCHRGLSHPGCRLALALLACRHLFWCRRPRRCCRASRNEPCSALEMEDEQVKKRNREAPPSLEAGYGSLTKGNVHPGHRPSIKASLPFTHLRSGQL